MNSNIKQFKRYEEELRSILDPQVTASSVTLVPLPAKSLLPPKSKGKTGKRTETVIGPIPITTQEDPLSNLTLAECLSWLEQQKIAIATDPQAKPLKESTGEPRIVVSPLAFNERIAFIPEQTINAHITDARSVELVWQSTNANTSQRVVMNYQKQQRFRSTIGVAPGNYLFGYVVNNRMRPDARYGQRLLLRPDAILARVTAPHEVRSLMLYNQRPTEEIVRLEANVPWLVPEIPRIRIPGRKTVKVLLRLLTREMEPGLNNGILSLLARRKETHVEAAAVCVSVVAEVKGAIPEIKHEPLEFGCVAQGAGELKFKIFLRAKGCGLLRGTIITHHVRDTKSFTLEANKSSWEACEFVVNSMDLPYRTDGSVKVTVLTDSYLADYRFHEIEIPYRLLYLDKSLPALIFRSVPKGSTRTIRLDVTRKDREEVQLRVDIPEGFRSFLKPYPGVRPNSYSFCFDTRRFPFSTTITGEVKLVDVLSGLQDRIKVQFSVGSSNGNSSNQKSTVETVQD